MRAGIRLNFAAYILENSVGMPFGGSRPAESRRTRRPIPQHPTACPIFAAACTGFHAANGSTRCAYIGID